MTATNARVSTHPRCVVRERGGSPGRGRRRAVRGALGMLLALATVAGLGVSAQAVFMRGTAASLSVGSLTLATPVVVVVDDCRPVLLSSSVYSATLTWPQVLRATSYLVTPVVNNTAQTAVSVTATSYTYQGPGSSLLGPQRTYRFTVRARVGNWTSPTATTPNVTC